jgi:ribosomal protein S12 methylthiotransferase accessory factor YcaO
MQTKTTLFLSALCVMFALGVSPVFAAGAMDDAVTAADEAAESASEAAEAKAEAAVKKEMKEAAQSKGFTAEEISGDVNPVDEGDAVEIKD